MSNCIKVVGFIIEVLFAVYLAFITMISIKTSYPLLGYSHSFDYFWFVKTYFATAYSRPEFYLYIETKTRFFGILQGAE